MTILIVDDSEHVRTQLSVFLRAAGHADVEACMSAEAALARLGLPTGEGAADVDLVLMDIEMPGTNGLEACRRIRACPDLADLPVIMVTGDDSAATLCEAFDAGAIDYIVKPLDRVVLNARAGCALRLKREIDSRRAREVELLDMTEQLEAVNDQLNRAIVDLHEASLTDALTGVANRRRLDETLTAEWRRATRYGRSLGLVILDVDHFKAFNDTCGHQEGDTCLTEVAAALRRALRRPTDLLARYGGEEFAVVLPEAEAAEAARTAEALRATVAGESLAHPASPAGRVTVSAGVATTVPTPGDSAAALLTAADAALYEAKEAGRDRVAAVADGGGVAMVPHEACLTVAE